MVTAPLLRTNAVKLASLVKEMLVSPAVEAALNSHKLRYWPPGPVLRFRRRCRYRPCWFPSWWTPLGIPPGSSPGLSLLWPAPRWATGPKSAPAIENLPIIVSYLLVPPNDLFSALWDKVSHRRSCSRSAAIRRYRSTRAGCILPAQTGQPVFWGPALE